MTDPVVPPIPPTPVSPPITFVRPEPARHEVPADPFGVAAIVPVYNTEQYVGHAIASVLGQTRPPVEVVVVDDGSTDRSAEIAHGFVPAVRVVSQPNGGVSAARNTGITATTAPWIAICDADDLWLPHRLERQVALLRTDPSLHAVFGWVEEFVSPELDPALVPTRATVQTAKGPLTTSVLVRRDVLMAVGLFDENLRVGDWVEWYARLHDHTDRIGVVPEVLARRRHHLDNNSQKQAVHQQEMVRSMKAHLDRMRARRDTPTP